MSWCASPCATGSLIDGAVSEVQESSNSRPLVQVGLLDSQGVSPVAGVPITLAKVLGPVMAALENHSSASPVVSTRALPPAPR